MKFCIVRGYVALLSTACTEKKIDVAHQPKKGGEEIEDRWGRYSRVKKYRVGIKKDVEDRKKVMGGPAGRSALSVGGWDVSAKSLAVVIAYFGSQFVVYWMRLFVGCECCDLFGQLFF